MPSLIDWYWSSASFQKPFGCLYSPLVVYEQSCLLVSHKNHTVSTIFAVSTIMLRNASTGTCYFRSFLSLANLFFSVVLRPEICIWALFSRFVFDASLSWHFPSHILGSLSGTEVNVYSCVSSSGLVVCFHCGKKEKDDLEMAKGEKNEETNFKECML